MPRECGVTSSQREEKARHIAAALAYLRHEAGEVGLADTVSALETAEKTVIREGQSETSGETQEARAPS
ncbi:hypothetical protein ACLRDC_16485 [Gluconacetobacter sacchari]|uniref:Uncharacterized protein n=2 Tax=Gluconacetobacter sacchari TaxID=92759 RepID=A0A7W4IGN8_9PROT|nr:hypothetical protein [Gluconacetobacter sacchari]MBB2162560.1 hypothetical protein [Gluconacetobacter sacchari]GBQ31142.1 hypothetical protein AA12717_3670 [Gluconacetobacter sacchari DSM 12717]